MHPAACYTVGQHSAVSVAVLASHFIDAGVIMRSVLPRSSPHSKTSAHNQSSWITSSSNKIPSALVCSPHKEDGQISLI